ncbi:hypothetical protein V7139_09230 [Neobacillus drentensis]|uniref:hypothetical protein n=1 Tax=Neobacillus drentensis TaxID=220684 RepID=UPI002FFF0378
MPKSTNTVNKGESFSNPMHNHPDFVEILLILEGEVTYNMDGTNHQTIVIYTKEYGTKIEEK